ncbi:MAG TPA: hypothetical protein VE397_16470 [Stellaceae bacterium]|nr:hypothetical protein [Stellaceae bacterium]
MLPTPSELREHARRLREAARAAPDASTRRQLAADALALAQLAEAIEHHQTIDQFTQGAKVQEYKRLLARALGARTASLLQDIAGKAAGEEAEQRDRIERYRLRAEELRAIADQFVVPSAQEGLRRAAANYDKMADDAETAFSGPRSAPNHKAG